MSTDDKATTATPPKIPALYFNKQGHGPDFVHLEITTVDRLPPPDKVACGIKISEGEPPYLLAPIGDGFMLDVSAVVELHHHLGQWLKVHGQTTEPGMSPEVLAHVRQTASLYAAENAPDVLRDAVAVCVEPLSNVDGVKSALRAAFLCGADEVVATLAKMGHR